MRNGFAVSHFYIRAALLKGIKAIVSRSVVSHMLAKFPNCCYNFLMNENEVLNKAFRYYEEAYNLCAPCEWFETDLNCEVKYLSGNTRYLWSLLCCGLKETLWKRENGIYEKDTLRKNAKNYYKLFYQNNRLLKVEDYVESRLIGYYLCFYRGSIRILKPFNRVKICDWLHYGIVTWFSEKGVDKEVWIDENGQIIYSEYTYRTDKVEFEKANCLPKAKYDKIQSYEKGIFYENGKSYIRIM